MKNRRGNFLTSILGKIFEKVLLNKVEGSIRISRSQNGGRKNRSTKDNWLALLPIVDRNKNLGRNTHVMFVDAEKCFDKLWLEDSLVDITMNDLKRKRSSDVV